MRYFSAIAILLLLAACHNKDSDSNNPGPVAIAIPAPQSITFTVDSVYPHDPHAFTQGLQFYNGKLYEGTGLNDESTLRIVNPKTGNVEKKYLIPDTSIFGEGITVFKDKIYQLTWKSNKVFVYNVSDITKPIKTLAWPHEGWGITNDGKQLIISDGSANLYFV